MEQDIGNKFKEILAGLSDDKKKQLYDKLRGMEPDERNRLIAEIVKKSEKKISEDDFLPVNKEEKSKEVKEIKEKEKSAVQKKAQPKSTPAPVKVKKKPNARFYKFIAVVFLVVVVIPVCGIMAYQKRADIKSIYHALKGEKPVVETTLETENTEPAQKGGDESVSSSETSKTDPTETPTPEPTKVEVRPDHPDLSGLRVVIDPGHQKNPDMDQEQVSPSSRNTKAKCTAGSEGSVTGIKEYELTMNVSNLVKEYLEQCGATVVLTRENNDINLSNQERAKLAGASNAQVFLRIHADAANDAKTSGIKVFVPEKGDTELGDILGNKLKEAEGLEFDKSVQTSAYTGLNYASSSIKSFQVSLGFLSNRDDEKVITDPDKQYEIAVAISEFLKEIRI